jgi:transcription initiation factor TFIIIB Brf1 subunit/transcription initiation factor TFIIB
MREKRKEICKKRLWRVLEPQEWLERYADWRKCQPGSPKRQAYEIIKRLAQEGKTVGSWTARVAAKSPRGNAAAKIQQIRSGQDQEPA